MKIKKIIIEYIILVCIILLIDPKIGMSQIKHELNMNRNLDQGEVKLCVQEFNSKRSWNNFKVKNKISEDIPFWRKTLNGELLIDSLVSIANDTAFQKMKTIYTYDDNNRLETYVREIEDEGELKYDQSILLTYYSDSRIESIYVVGWGDDGRWGNDYQIIFSYDNNGNEIQSIYQKWDETSASWKNNNLSEYTYDASNNLILELYSEWNNGNWVVYSIVESSFDSNDNQTIEVTYSIVDDKWVPNYKLEWNYDSNNNLVEEFRHVWDNQTNTYRSDYWVIYTLDENNRTVAELVMTWNETINDWENFSQDLFKYDENGNKVNSYRYVWKNNIWVPDFERKLDYSQEYLLSVESNYTWNGASWDEGTRITFSYDEQSNFTSAIREIWNGFQWEKADGYLYLPQYYNVESFMSGFHAMQGSELKVYYQEVTDVESENITKHDFTLYQNYPNPFNPSTVIKYQIPKESFVTLIIYDVLGREVKTLVNQKQIPGNYEVTFDASRYSSGVYFYQLSSKSFTSTKKLIYLE